MASLARVLKTDVMADMDLRALAQVLRSKGRGRDTVLAHITPREAQMLKDRGGRGSINPDTGLPEFEDFGGFAGADYGFTPSYTPDMGAAAASPPDMGFSVAPQTDAGMFGFTAPQADAGAVSAEPYSAYVAPAAVPGAPGGPVVPGGSAALNIGATAGAAPGVSAMPQGVPMDVESTVPTAAQAQQQALAQRGLLGQVGDWLGQPKNLLGLGGVLGMGGLGLLQRQQAMQQAAAAQKQIGALGKPLQQQGQQLISQAQAGSLSPASMQSYQAAQAQLAQNVARTGGVGAAQAASQLEMIRQQLLNNQLQLGMQQLAAGNQYVYQGIMAGLNTSQAANQAMGQFAGALGSMIGGRAGVF